MIGAALASACRVVTGATVEWRCHPYGSAQRISSADRRCTRRQRVQTSGPPCLL